MTDFLFRAHGTLGLLTPVTDAAKAWVDEHIGEDNGYQPYLPTLVIEHHYIADILNGLTADGLTVEED